MPESSLASDYLDLKAEVGHYLGYGRAYAAFSSEQSANVEANIKSGLRRFYFAHPWTFLKPLWTLPLQTNVDDYDLPEEWGGFDGDMTIQGTSGGYWNCLRQVGEGMIRERRAQSSSRITGQPTMFATRPKQLQHTHGQRWELMFYPTPDAVYTAKAAMTVLPDKLTVDKIYPYGGAAHAETIKAACLAAAELDVDGTVGPKDAQFKQLLQMSIALDARMKPALVGYNADRSVSRRRGERYRQPTLQVSVNGTLTTL